MKHYDIQRIYERERLHGTDNLLGRFHNSRPVGLSAIRDTYNRAFKEWNEDYKFLTELVLVLNHKIWQHHKSRPEVAALYNDLWKQADLYAVENLKDDELNYFFEVTD